LVLKRSKCFFGARSVSYLGHTISANDVAMDEDKVQAVLAWPVPSTVRVVSAFLGLASYYRRFIKDYDAITTPLTKLLRKGSFNWTPEAVDAFRTLQRTRTSAPVLKLPAFDEEFIVECDTSGSSIGVVLH
jgi:hypothetical protein